MTIQQLTVGKEIMDKISRREELIDIMRENMKDYIENSSKEMLDLDVISSRFTAGKYIGSFSAEEICTLVNNRIAKLEEEIKELKKEFESL